MALGEQGRLGEAIAALREGIALLRVGASGAVDPRFAFLRARPEFRALAAGMNLPF